MFEIHFNILGLNVVRDIFLTATMTEFFKHLTFPVSVCHIPPMLSSNLGLRNYMCSSVKLTKIFHYAFMFILHIFIISSSKYIQSLKTY
jgi:hypothetical protein